MTVKGHEFNAPLIRDSFDRRALQFKNNIITLLRKIGVVEDDVEIPLQPVAYKRGKASASWYFEGQNLYYSYGLSRKFVENIYVVFKVIEAEVDLILSKEKTVEQFVLDFSEDRDVEEKRKEARKLLGVEEDCNDLELIGQHYKKMAKEYHPDVEGGSTEKFKEVNKAHKMLKRELS
ncbi:DnaJ domain-containing protein [Candidatus Woesearchaeota archaeon]|nr:DnaJ domain-containing protein [Candidatus Woesearchaeota archaeon]MBT5342905.1 DnaJ domain-containing protein [Candidatus Woesearchaeota archaeon]